MERLTLYFTLNVFSMILHLQATDLKENINPNIINASDKLVSSQVSVDKNNDVKDLCLPQKEFRHKEEMFEEDIKSLSMVYEEIYLFKTFSKDKRYFTNKYLRISPEIINPRFLTVLSLRVCGLRDDHIKEIYLFPHLKKLDLCLNCLTDSGVKPILKLLELEYLDLSYNKLSNDGVFPLAHILPLMQLDISSNEKISDEGVHPFLEHPNIKKLSIRFNQITSQMNARLKERIEEVEYFPGN